MENLLKTILILAFLSSCSKGKDISFSPAGEGVTFQVCDVEKAKELLSEQKANDVILQIASKKQEVLFGEPNETPDPKLLCSSVEGGQLIPSESNAFAQAVYLAYAQHRPLVISPDMIWLLITQGFTIHVKENAEDLRDIFVDHKGQVNLDVARGSYEPSSRVWWEGIFPDFSKEIAANTKEEVWGFVAPKFSTTTLVEKAAFEITLMDAMSPYFQYSISIICGIPEITLEGKPEDWDKIRKQLDQLDKYGLDWWTDDLRNIIDEFANASRGKMNKEFWADIFDKRSDNSGCGSTPYITGWMADLFPYFVKGKDKEGKIKYLKNPLLEGTEGKPRTGLQYRSASVEMGDFPGGLSRAKVLLNDNGVMTTLNFNAGFVGLTQDKKSLALRPDIQWYVTDLQIPPTKEEIEKYEKRFEK